MSLAEMIGKPIRRTASCLPARIFAGCGTEVEEPSRSTPNESSQFGANLGEHGLRHASFPGGSASAPIKGFHPIHNNGARWVPCHNDLEWIALEARRHRAANHHAGLA